MRIKPLTVFFLVLCLLALFDYAMWSRYQKIIKISSLILDTSTQISNIYRNKSITPLSRNLRVRVNLAHDELLRLSKPWPINNQRLNMIFLKVVCWVLIPILMLWLLWLHFRFYRKKEENRGEL